MGGIEALTKDPEKDTREITGTHNDPKGLARTPEGPKQDRTKGENCNTAAWRRFCDAFLNLALKKQAIYLVKMQILKKRSKRATISGGFFTFAC